MGPYLNIGGPNEDGSLVTPRGFRLRSTGAPREIATIEAVMNERRPKTN